MMARCQTIINHIIKMHLPSRFVKGKIGRFAADMAMQVAANEEVRPNERWDAVDEC